MMEDKYFADTPERAIRKALWLDIHKGKDLDWDLLFDGERVGAMYDDLGGLKQLSAALNITVDRCKIVLGIHGKAIRSPGGGYKREGPELPPLDLSAVREIGAGYSEELRRVLIVHSSERVRTCPAQCPNAIPCWSAPIRGKRAKKRDCTLRDHLIAVGVINA